jgi:hypothetical protein
LRRATRLPQARFAAPQAALAGWFLGLKSLRGPVQFSEMESHFKVRLR